MNTEFLKDIGVGFLLVVLQLLFFNNLPVFGATADPIIFYLLYLVSKYDRVNLLFLAALLGLFQDAFFDLWGMNMFSKTMLVFLTYSFVKRRSENQLLLWQIFVIIFNASLIHFIIFWGLSSFFSAYTASYSPFVLIFGNTLYTALAGSLIFIFRVR